MLIYDHEALPDITARDLDRVALFERRVSGHPPRRAPPQPAPSPGRALRPGGEPWVGGTPTSAWYRITSDACRGAGFTPQVGFASDDPVPIQALVAAGLGVSLIPGRAVAPLPRSGAPVRHISAARPRDAYHGP